MAAAFAFGACSVTGPPVKAAEGRATALVVVACWPVLTMMVPLSESEGDPRDQRGVDPGMEVGYRVVVHVDRCGLIVAGHHDRAALVRENLREARIGVRVRRDRARTPLDDQRRAAAGIRDRDEARVRDELIR